MAEVLTSSSLTDDNFDSLIVIFDDIQSLAEVCPDLHTRVAAYQQINAKTTDSTSVLEFPKLPSKRLVLSPTGPLNRDYDDARRIYDAAIHGIEAASNAGSKKPLLALAPLKTMPSDEPWAAEPYLTLNMIMGSLQASYTPLELRELSNYQPTCEAIGIYLPAEKLKSVDGDGLRSLSKALEEGREVARDIGGSDPERMAAPRIVEYVKSKFGTGAVTLEVEDVDEKKYPLMAAVNRAASGVDRHAGRVIHMNYQGEGETDTTLMLVGKGITYDTGGADIKAGGVMAGMHRDKCGAAAVIGFFKVLDLLRPKGIRVIGSVACVRNSVGSNCYVADEIITSRAGARVRVGNTDAEGRMVMADLLCLMKERALADKHPNPQIFTWATLTGHVIRAYGEHYTAIMDNGKARKGGVAREIQKAGDLISDPFEISTIRRDDFEFHTGKSIYENVLQCNNKPSSMTARGHMGPSAFLIMASGMDKHGLDSKQPISYSHVDVAGSSGPFPGVPTGAPILAFAAKYIFPRLGFIR